jgi:hypothetical protein
MHDADVSRRKEGAIVMAMNRGSRGGSGKQSSKPKRNSEPKPKKKGEQSGTDSTRADSPEGGEHPVRDHKKQQSDE